MVVQPLDNIVYTNCLPANEYSMLTDNKGEVRVRVRVRVRTLKCAVACFCHAEKHTTL